MSFISLLWWFFSYYMLGGESTQRQLMLVQIWSSRILLYEVILVIFVCLQELKIEFGVWSFLIFLFLIYWMQLHYSSLVNNVSFANFFLFHIVKFLQSILFHLAWNFIIQISCFSVSIYICSSHNWELELCFSFS